MSGTAGGTRTFMARIRAGAHANDRGFSLVEVLVATALFSVLMGIIASIVVTANQVQRRTTDGVATQGVLLDSVQRVTRDVASADPVLKATKADVTFQVVRGPGTSARCVRSRYFLASGVLSNQITTFASISCPDIADPVGTDATTPLPSGATKQVTKVATNLKNTDVTGLFRYYDEDNREFVLDAAHTSVVDTDLGKITRVGIRVDAPVRDRPKGVQLVTSAAIRKGLTPDVVQDPGTTLGTPVLSGTLLSNTGKLTWTGPVEATGWVLTRDDEVIARINNGSVHNYDDENLVPGGTYVYQVYATSKSGTSPGSNKITLSPLVGDLPNGTSDESVSTPMNGHCETRTAPYDPGPGPAAPQYQHCDTRSIGPDADPVDGNYNTPTIEDNPKTGGLTADMTVSTIPPAPIYGWVGYTVPLYDFVKRERPVYGNVPYTVPDYGYVSYTVPYYGTVTTSEPIYGYTPDYHPVYGFVPQTTQVPVYGNKPKYGPKDKYSYVQISSRSVTSSGSKCYIRGTSLLPQPDCDADATPGGYVSSASIVGSDGKTYPILKYAPETPASNVPGGSWLLYAGPNRQPSAVSFGGNDRVLGGGNCDSYIYVKPGLTYQPDIGNFTKISDPASKDGRWAGSKGYGWYIACMWRPTLKLVKTTTQELIGYEYGIIGYNTVVTGYTYGIVRYEIFGYFYGIIGYTTANTYGVIGYNTYSYYTQVGSHIEFSWQQIGTEQYDSYEQVGTTIEYRYERVDWTEPKYTRTYTLRWTGTGPCPGVNLPKSTTIDTYGADPGETPTKLHVAYDAAAGVAKVYAEGVNSPNPILTASVPQKCTYA